MPRKKPSEGLGPARRLYDKQQPLGDLFAPMPLSIMGSTLTDAAKLTWARLAFYAGADGRAFPKIESLARELNHGESKVERSLAELRAKGYMESKRRPNRSSLYRLFLPVPPKMTEPEPAEMREPEPSKMRYIKDQVLKDQLEKRADAESQPANRIRDSQAEVAARLEAYFGETPNDGFVERVRSAVRHANQAPVSDALIIAELDSMEADYPRGHAKGPRTWKWFEVTLANRFRAARAEADRCALPAVASAPAFELEEFEEPPF